jgi:hypothetical protein
MPHVDVGPAPRISSRRQDRVLISERPALIHFARGYSSRQTTLPNLDHATDTTSKGLEYNNFELVLRTLQRGSWTDADQSRTRDPPVSRWTLNDRT